MESRKRRRGGTHEGPTHTEGAPHRRALDTTKERPTQGVRPTQETHRQFALLVLLGWWGNPIIIMAVSRCRGIGPPSGISFLGTATPPMPIRRNTPKKPTRVAAPSPRASLGRRTVCGRTEQRRPPVSKRYENKVRMVWGSFLIAIAAAALKTPTRNGYNAQGVNLTFCWLPNSSASNFCIPRPRREQD